MPLSTSILLSMFLSSKALFKVSIKFCFSGFVSTKLLFSSGFITLFSSIKSLASTINLSSKEPDDKFAVIFSILFTTVSAPV